MQERQPCAAEVRARCAVHAAPSARLHSCSISAALSSAQFTVLSVRQVRGQGSSAARFAAYSRVKEDPALVSSETPPKVALGSRQHRLDARAQLRLLWSACMCVEGQAGSACKATAWQHAAPAKPGCQRPPSHPPHLRPQRVQAAQRIVLVSLCVRQQHQIVDRGRPPRVLRARVARSGSGGWMDAWAAARQNLRPLCMQALRRAENKPPPPRPPPLTQRVSVRWPTERVTPLSSLGGCGARAE